MKSRYSLCEAFEYFARFSSEDGTASYSFLFYLFEEKIDAMISSKKELADMSVNSGESWLARMSHEELKALFDR